MYTLDSFWEELLKRINNAYFQRKDVEFKKNKELKFIYWSAKGQGLKWACCLAKTIKPWIELEINPLKGAKQEGLYNKLLSNKHSIQAKFNYQIEWDDEDKNLSRMSSNRQMYRIKSTIDFPFFHELDSKQQQELLLNQFVERMKDFMLSFEQFISFDPNSDIPIQDKKIAEEYIPQKKDCDKAIKELKVNGEKGTDENVRNRIEKNLISEGVTLHPDWWDITLDNMKDWCY